MRRWKAGEVSQAEGRGLVEGRASRVKSFVPQMRAECHRNFAADLSHDVDAWPTT